MKLLKIYEIMKLRENIVKPRGSYANKNSLIVHWPLRSVARTNNVP